MENPLHLRIICTILNAESIKDTSGELNNINELYLY